jgi:hypothetical protein
MIQTQCSSKSLASAVAYFRVLRCTNEKELTETATELLELLGFETLRMLRDRVDGRCTGGATP